MAHTENTRAEPSKLAGDVGRTNAALARTTEELEAARAEATRLEGLISETIGAADRVSSRLVRT